MGVQAAADLDTPKVLAAVADLSLWFKAHVPDVLDVHPAGMHHHALVVGFRALMMPMLGWGSQFFSSQVGYGSPRAGLDA